MSVSEPARPVTMPYLECFAERGGPPERVPLLRMPFVIGRSESVDHIVYSGKVSKEHATIDRIGDRYIITDLVSTNGTFVNGQRTVETFLQDGDIIQIAHKEFCFRQPLSVAAPASKPPLVEQTQFFAFDGLDSVMRGTQLLEELIADEAIETLYQPIVDLATGGVIGYEALTRGRHPKLSESPTALLRLAEQCEMVVAVSELFRRVAVRSACRLDERARIFVNVHAREVVEPRLLDGLAALRREACSQRIVLEIAEGSMTDVRMMTSIKDAIGAMGFQLAYDDFGIGQSRLLELTDVPPDYLKLDIAFTQSMTVNHARREMLSAVLRVVGSLGTRVIAEGIECQDVAEMCRAIGCHLGQGYYFGRPASPR